MLSPSFEFVGFLFYSRSMLVDSAAAEKGLRFAGNGMRVQLPIAAGVSMRVGTPAGPVAITAKTLRGRKVAAQTAAFNAFGDVSMRSGGAGIAVVEFTGGNNEALLVRLCIDEAAA